MSRVRMGLAFLGWWAGLFLFYLLLAAKCTTAEEGAGALAGAVGATAVLATRTAGRRHFRPRLRWLRHLAHLPWRVLADCGIVAAALGRRLIGSDVAGSFHTVPFAAGGDDPEAAARRALVTAGVSLAPNTYVVAIDRERGELLVHQLVPSREPPGHGNREWPL